MTFETFPALEEIQSTCPAEGSILLPHEDCTKYYQCSDGVAHVFDCPAGLHFSPELLICTYSEDAGCEVDLPTVPPSEEPSFEEPDCPAGENVLVPYPGDCTKFYQCADGTAYVFDCPPGLHFSPVLLVCTYPEDAQCEVPTTLLYDFV